MSMIHFETDVVQIPVWVSDLGSFRRWMDSDEAPEKATVSYLAGEVRIDMSKEQLYSHNRVKTEFARVLATLALHDDLGEFFGDGVFLANGEADLSAKPDGTFVAHESFDSNRIQLIEGSQDGFVELDGTPDMVLEVLSDSSVGKDTELLRDLYWQAGIAEYWLVDARRDRCEFDILRHTSRGYSTVRKSAGWIKSAVFGKAFRLTRKTNRRGHPEFKLEVQ